MISVFLHRAGHLIWGTLIDSGGTAEYIGGIFFQLLIPMAAVEYFRRNSNPFQTAVACGIFCTNFLWLSMYVDGAEEQVFPPGLGSETTHDWWYILDTFQLVHIAPKLAWVIHVGALIALGACLYSILYQLYYMVMLEERRVGSRRSYAKRAAGTEKDLIVGRRMGTWE